MKLTTIIVLAIAICFSLWSSVARALPEGAIARLEDGEIGLSNISSISFSSANSMLASVSRGSEKVILWNIENSQHVAIPEDSPYHYHCVSFSPDGSLLAMGGFSLLGAIIVIGGEGTVVPGIVDLWDVAKSSVVATLKRANGYVSSVSFSNDGKLLAGGGGHKINTISLWNVADRNAVAILKGHSGEVRSVSFSPNDNLLASGSQDTTVKLWEVISQQEIATLIGHSGSVGAVSFSPDGILLASGSSDNTVKVWDVETHLEVSTLAMSAPVYSVSFSPDGKILAAGSADGTVRMWDVSDLRKARTLKGHSDSVNSVVFSPDGKFLASGSSDTTILLWDTTGELAVDPRNRLATLWGQIKE